MDGRLLRNNQCTWPPLTPPAGLTNGDCYCCSPAGCNNPNCHRPMILQFQLLLRRASTTPALPSAQYYSKPHERRGLLWRISRILMAKLLLPHLERLDNRQWLAGLSEPQWHTAPASRERAVSMKRINKSSGAFYVVVLAWFGIHSGCGDSDLDWKWWCAGASSSACS